MSNKLKGLLLGSLFSLGGVALFILIYFLGFISTYVAVAIAYLFYLGYNMMVKERKDTSFYVMVSVVTIVAICLSIGLYVVILASKDGLTISELLDIADNKSTLMKDLLLSVAFGIVGIVLVIFDIKRREKIAAQNNNQY